MSIKYVLAAMIVAISASAANAVPLRYEILDQFDLIRPDLSPGEPLDKGFAVTGTMDATRLGFFEEGESPFAEWDITETVRNSDGTLSNYIFNEHNSVWKLDQAPPASIFPSLNITEFEILLLQTTIAPTANNTLTLESTFLDQRFFWSVPDSGQIPNIFASQVISTGEFNGVYVGGNGQTQIGLRTAAVPAPTTLGLVAGGLALLGFVGRLHRRRAGGRDAGGRS